MRAFGYVLAFLLAVAGIARAEQDKSLLEGFLEQALSGKDRRIAVHGLAGALNSRATIEELTISDDAGVWLTMKGAELDWNRLALLRGRFSVNTLRAEEIIIARPPGQTTRPRELPTPEAQPFQLPDLPVSIELDKIAVDRLVLGEPVLGVAAQLKIDGALTLDAGALDTRLEMVRLDRPGDRAKLLAQFSNETRIINLDLSVTEAAGGLISAALRMPDRPSLRLTARGEGPVADFTADIALASAGVERVTGQVRLHGLPPEEAAPGGIGFDARLAGDVTPFLPAEDRAFFGPQARLAVSGARAADGRVEVRALSVVSDALHLEGAFAITADGQPERVDLRGDIRPPTGESVILPLPGPPTAVEAATLVARLDRAARDDWQLAARISGLARPGLRIARADLSAGGPVVPGEALRGRLQGRLEGIVADDPALARAIGDSLALSGGFALTADRAVRLQGMELTGADYRATIEGTVQGLAAGFAVNGQATARAADIARFSGLAGRDLGGAITARLAGSGVPLSGSFDIELTGRARDLRIGVSRLDPLTAGATAVRISAARDETGLTIRDFRIDGAQVAAEAQGHIRSGDSALTFGARLADLSLVEPRLNGPVTLRGDLARTNRGWSGQVALKGPHASRAELDLSLPPDGAATARFEARLDRLERLVPELPGALALRGDARRAAGGLWRVAGEATGPGGMAARIAGDWSETSGKADLSATGAVRLDIANLFMAPNALSGTAKFDLTMKGAPSLAALKGTVTTRGATLALPTALQTVRNIDAEIAIADAQARLDLTGDLGAGGSFHLSGPVQLTAPFDSRIAVDLRALGLTDKTSFTSSATGKLVYAGPLGGGGTLSGRLDFGDTDINLGAIAGSAGAAPIPPIRHVAEPAAVRATRERARLIQDGKAGAGPEIALDLVLAAVNRVQVHGFGIQAEMGGLIRVTGSTRNVQPLGQIEMIRGTLTLLGRRLRLTRGSISLQGGLSPHVAFAASTSTDEGDATILIAGPMNAPEIEVRAQPERPPEEALAMLLFGNRFSQMSPLVIAQLAASLARLGHDSGKATQELKGATGIDAISVGEDASGATSVSAGGYLAENVYSDVTVNTEGDAQLNLNLDLNDSLSVRGMVDNAGDTSIGLFFQRDY